MESRGKDLLKNTGILVVAKISTQIVSFLLLPLYTALLSTAEYGEIDLYASFIMILIPFLTLQLEMGIFKFLITEKNDHNQKCIISTAFIFIGIMISAGTVIYWIIAGIFSFNYVLLVYLYYLTTTIMTVLLQICRGYGDNKAYAMASFVSSSFAVLLNVVFVAILRMKVEGILLASIIANSISIIYMVKKTYIFRYLGLQFYDKDMGNKLLRYSIPLVFNQIASWAINYSDRVIILSKWGMGYNGVYSLANKFSSIMNTFFNVFNLAWTENVCKCLEDRDNIKYINMMFMLIFNIYLALVTGIVNLLPFFFYIMVNNNYYVAYGHVPILLLATFFSGIAATIGSVYIAYGRTKEVSLTTFLACICNIIVHLALLNICGLYAASISTLVSFAMLFIYRFIFIQKFFTLHINLKNILIQFALFLISYLFYIVKNPLLIIFGLLLNLSFILYITIKNKEILMSMIKRKS